MSRFQLFHTLRRDVLDHRSRLDLEARLTANTRALAQHKIDATALREARLPLWRALRAQGVPDSDIAALSGFTGPLTVTRALK